MSLKSVLILFTSCRKNSFYSVGIFTISSFNRTQTYEIPIKCTFLRYHSVKNIFTQFLSHTFWFLPDNSYIYYNLLDDRLLGRGQSCVTHPLKRESSFPPFLLTYVSLMSIRCVLNNWHLSVIHIWKQTHWKKQDLGFRVLVHEKILFMETKVTKKCSMKSWVSEYFNELLALFLTYYWYHWKHC